MLPVEPVEKQVFRQGRGCIPSKRAHFVLLPPQAEAPHSFPRFSSSTPKQCFGVVRKNEEADMKFSRLRGNGMKRVHSDVAANSARLF